MQAEGLDRARGSAHGITVQRQCGRASAQLNSFDLNTVCAPEGRHLQRRPIAEYPAPSGGSRRWVGVDARTRVDGEPQTGGFFDEFALDERAAAQLLPRERREWSQIHKVHAERRASLAGGHRLRVEREQTRRRFEAQRPRGLAQADRGMDVQRILLQKMQMGFRDLQRERVCLDRECSGRRREIRTQVRNRPTAGKSQLLDPQLAVGPRRGRRAVPASVQGECVASRDPRAAAFAPRSANNRDRRILRSG
jgi:hypothetical protein